MHIKIYDVNSKKARVNQYEKMKILMSEKVF